MMTGLTITKFILKTGAGNLVSKGMDKIIDKLSENPIDKAYDKALKRWCKNDQIRKSLSAHKFSHFEEFEKYIENKDICNNEIYDLCVLFEEELQKDEKAYHFLNDLVNKSLQKEQREIRQITNDLKEQNQELSDKIDKIFTVIKEGQRKLVPTVSVKSEEGFTYISRTCLKITDKENSLLRYLNPDKYPDYCLADYVIGINGANDNKFVLCGNAQSGKTTELRQLFSVLKDCGLYRLYYKEVKGWPVFDLPDLSEEEQRGTVVIIDALDERFNDEQRNALFNCINSYARKHEFLRMVLSCRSNFKELERLDCFVQLELQDLKWKDAISIIRDRCYDSEALISEIERKRLDEWIQTPLYLNSLIDYHNLNKSLPDNRIDLYEFIIEQQLSKEDKKGLTSHSTIQKDKEALMFMAVSLQMMEKNFLSEENVLEIMDDNDLWAHLQRTGMLERSEEGYGFVHNSFKEYLVSVFLNHWEKLEDIKKVCCYGGNDVINSTWYNVIVCYLANLSKDNPMFNEIIDWLESSNIDLMLYVEPKLIDENKRKNIFVGIIEDYKTKGLLYAFRNNNLVEALMKFGFCLETIQYIKEELNKAQQYDIHLMNVLRCTRYIDWIKLEISDKSLLLFIEDAIFDVFGKFCNNPNAWAIWEPFENQYFNDKRTIEKFLYYIKDAKHPRICDHLIRFICEYNLADDYVGVVIQKSDYIHDYKDNGVNCSMPQIWVSCTLGKVVSKQSLQQVFDFVHHSIIKDNSRSDYIKDYYDLLDKVIINAEKVYSEDDLSSVLQNIYEDCAKKYSSRVNTSKFVKPIVTYFYKTNKAERLFLHYVNKMAAEYDNKNRKLYYAFAKCASSFVNEKLFESIAKQNYDVEKYYYILSCLKSNMDKDCSKRILTDNFPSYYIDYDESRLDDERRELELLFDYDSFRKTILLLLDNENLSNESLYKRLDDDESEQKTNKYVSSFFYQSMTGDNYDFAEIREMIDNLDSYNCFVIKETYEYMVSKDNVLSESQKDTIIKNAKDLIIKVAEHKYQLNPNCRYGFIDLMLKDYIKGIDKSHLLKLLQDYYNYTIYDSSSSDDLSLFDYVTNQVEIITKDMTDFINELIVSNKSISWSIKIKLGKYIVKHKLVKSYCVVVDWAKNDNSQHIIDLLVDNSDTRKLIAEKNIVDSFPVTNRLYLYQRLIQLSEFDVSWIKQDLECIFDSLENDEKTIAAKLLLMLGSLIGLKYVNGNQDLYLTLDMLPNYNYKEAIPDLFLSFEYIMNKKDEHDRLHLYETKSCILSSIGNIAIQSNENFESVSIRIKALIDSNKATYSFLNSYLDEWRHNMYKSKTKVISINDIKTVLADYKMIS